MIGRRIMKIDHHCRIQITRSFRNLKNNLEKSLEVTNWKPLKKATLHVYELRHREVGLQFAYNCTKSKYHFFRLWTQLAAAKLSLAFYIRHYTMAKNSDLHGRINHLKNKKSVIFKQTQVIHTKSDGGRLIKTCPHPNRFAFNQTL